MLRRCRSVSSGRRCHAKLHDESGARGVGDVEVIVGLATAERLIGSEVAEFVATERDAGEVNDHVSPLGGRKQEAFALPARFTGAGRNPPSEPICHTFTPGMRAKSRIRKRELQPLSSRNR